MGGRAILLAILVAVPAIPAVAQSPPDGHHCTAQAFTNIGGIHGEGVGEVTLTTDATYRQTGARFEYLVRDRFSGWVRLSATWDLTGAKPDPLGAMRSLRIPFHGSPGAMPASIAFNLDETSLPVPPVPLSSAAGLELQPDGRVTAVTLGARNGAMPELRGHRMVSYRLLRADGLLLASDLFLLPDWRRLSGSVRSAASRARSKLRKRRCDPYFIIHRQPQSRRGTPPARA